MIPTAPKRKNGSSRKHDGKRTKEGAAVVAEMEGVAAAEDGDGLATPDGGSVQGDSEATHSMGGAELAALNKKSEARKARKLKGELLIYGRQTTRSFLSSPRTRSRFPSRVWNPIFYLLSHLIRGCIRDSWLNVPGLG